MCCMAHEILIGIYGVGALLEIGGILWTAKDVTVRDPGNGTVLFMVPKGWEAARGPATIIVGILVGLLGNIIWLCSS
jgi:hypothetical protein